MKKLVTLSSLLVLVLMISSSAMAQNQNRSFGTVSGEITNDTLWASDTVRITGDLIIPDTVTLTINPGTVVMIDSAVYIDVYGRILANGAPNDSIVFRSVDTTGLYDFSNDGWQGIYFNGPLSSDSSRFSYCIFEHFKSSNTSRSAIHLYEFSKVIVNNCRFSYNYHPDAASCITGEYDNNMTIIGNKFTYNYAYHSCIEFGCSSSGDLVQPLIEGNIFMHNYGSYEGSCLKISGYSTARVINNVFVDNYSDGYGGAIVISGYSSPVLIGNLIAYNYAYYNGGGVAVKYYTNPTFINNTIVYNETADDGGGVYVGCSTDNIVFQNNIIWGNISDTVLNQLYCNDGGTTGYRFENNLIQGGLDSIYFSNLPYEGISANMIDMLPMFVDSLGGDFHLTCGSPAVDAGMNPILPLPLTDIDGVDRLNGINFDLGAFEQNSNAIIISQPQNVSVVTGSVATFSISATNATAFHWEVSTDFGTTWTALTDNAIYSGSTTNMLTVNADYTMNGNMYRCGLTGSCPESVSFSNFVFLIVNYNVGLSENNADFSVYPNPATDNVFVEGAMGSRIYISDLNGRVVYAGTIGSDRESVSVSDFESGIYMMKIVNSESMQIVRLVIK